MKTSLTSSSKSNSQHTIAEQLRLLFSDMTPSERQLATLWLENYPMAGIGSITQLAQNGAVSTPTITRLIKKLGFNGFSAFQKALHVELEDTLSTPLSKHDKWASAVPQTHVLHQFADAVVSNLQKSLEQVDTESFDAIVSLLADDRHHLHIVGGRISQSIATYLHAHLQIMRRKLTLLNANANQRPHYVINMEAADVLVIFDIRRYEYDLLKLAEMAKKRGVTVVLFTDQWGSPVAKHADHTIFSRIEVPSAWDSTTVIVFMVEAIIADLQNRNWTRSKDRMQALEDLVDESKLFKKAPPTI